MKSLRGNRVVLGLGLCAGLAISSANYAQDKTETGADQQHYAEVGELLDRTRNDAQLYAQAVEAGKGRTLFCKTCHGEDGIAKRPGVPNLAGQNPLYLYSQLERFSDGRRYDFMMAGLAQGLSRTDILNIALYYSSLQPKAAGGGAAKLMEGGKETYQARCAACHQPNAAGNGEIPRLAGQQPDYLGKMLREFRDSTGRRDNTQMSAVAAGLSDQQIAGLAAYLAGLE